MRCIEVSGSFCGELRFACNFTLFSESRLWECCVFTVFGDRLVRFDCIFTGFADNRLWEYRIFSFKNAWHQSLVFFRRFSICSCSLRLCNAFVRLWEVLPGFGKLWEALEGFAGFARFCVALGGFVGQS